MKIQYHWELDVYEQPPTPFGKGDWQEKVENRFLKSPKGSLKKKVTV
jgi:hypothetical protein